jgi:hypothetical protein
VAQIERIEKELKDANVKRDDLVDQAKKLAEENAKLSTAVDQACAKIRELEDGQVRTASVYSEKEHQLIQLQASWKKERDQRIDADKKIKRDTARLQKFFNSVLGADMASLVRGVQQDEHDQRPFDVRLGEALRVHILTLARASNDEAKASPALPAAAAATSSSSGGGAPDGAAPSHRRDDDDDDDVDESHFANRTAGGQGGRV